MFFQTESSYLLPGGSGVFSAEQFYTGQYFAYATLSLSIFNGTTLSIFKFCDLFTCIFHFFYPYLLQVRDSLSKTLNCKVLETLGKLEPDSLDHQTDNSGQSNYDNYTFSVFMRHSHEIIALCFSSFLGPLIVIMYRGVPLCTFQIHVDF